MTAAYTLKAKIPARRWIIWGIPFISLIGSMMHFVYAWSGNLLIAGILAPINESIWEHLKMTFWTALLWWSLGYFILGKRNNISAAKWFFSGTIALLICPLFIVSFYYSYTGAFGIHSLLLDITSLFLGVIIAQLTALHIYRYAKLNHCWLYCAFAVIFLLMAAFIVFTFTPLHIPLFIDSQTGKYGI